MTVMAAEAGAGAAEAGAAEASSGARSAFGRQGGRTQQGTRRRPVAGGPMSRGGHARSAAPQGRAGGTSRASSGGPVTSNRQGGAQRRAPGRAARRTITAGQDRTSYQAVVLAEFVAAVLLIAATPFARRQSEGVSPYEGADLLQIVAVTIVYFLLALLSGANRGAGRFAAWFGALVLLTVGLGEAARLAKLLNVFGLQAPSSGQGEGEGTGGVES